MKRFLLIVLLTFACLSVYSIDVNTPKERSISADGYGSTASEAQKNAEQKLRERIFGTYVVTVTSTKASEGTYGSSLNSFSSSSNSISYGKLLAVNYSPATLVGNEYKITASIEYSATNVYRNELRRLSGEIRQEYQKSFSSLDDRKNQLLKLIELTQQFEDYKQVLIVIGDDGIPDLPIPESIKSLTDQLESVYTELLNIAEDNSRWYDDANVRAQLELLRKEQEDLIKLSNQSQIEQRLMYEQNLKESIGRIIESYVVDSSSVVSGFSIEEDLKAVKESIENYNNIVDKYNQLVWNSQAKNSNELKLGISSIESKEYRTAEKGKDGKPTDFAVKRRAEEIEAFKKQKNSELSDQLKLIEDMLKNDIQSAYDSMVDNCTRMEDRVYTINSAVAKWSSLYDGEKYEWIISVKENYCDFDFSIAYKDVEGSAPPTLTSEKAEYDAYKDKVDAYTDNLRSLAPFTIEISVAIDANRATVLYSVEKIKINYTKTQKTGSITPKEAVKSTPLGITAARSDFSWLKPSKNFNSKADKITTQVAKAEQKVTVEANSTLSKGIFRRFSFIPKAQFVVKAVGMDSAEKNVFVGFELALNIKYILSDSLYLGVEPFYSIVFMGKPDSPLEKKSFSSYGAYLDFGITYKSIGGLGVKVGLSKNGFLIDLYGVIDMASVDKIIGSKTTIIDAKTLLEFGLVYESYSKAIGGSFGVGIAF